MEKQNKTLIISIVIFVVTAIIALVLILNKGKIFGKSLVATTGENGAEITASTPIVHVESDKEYLSVKDKETAKLTVTVDGVEQKEGVTYTSSDESIAKVENGVVTPVGVGTAEITAKYKDGEGKVEIQTITPIKTMKFTATSSTIRVGSDLQLKLQVTPSDASIDTLIYSSSNDEIATVNKNGIVTGVQRGQVTITLLDTYTGTEKSVKLTIR